MQNIRRVKDSAETSCCNFNSLLLSSPEPSHTSKTRQLSTSCTSPPSLLPTTHNARGRSTHNTPLSGSAELQTSSPCTSQPAASQPPCPPRRCNVSYPGTMRQIIKQLSWSDPETHQNHHQGPHRRVPSRSASPSSNPTSSKPVLSLEMDTYKTLSRFDLVIPITWPVNFNLAQVVSPLPNRSCSNARASQCLLSGVHTLPT